VSRGIGPEDEPTSERQIDAVIEQRVRAEGLLSPGRAVVVLISGGRDSTCLLDLAVRIAGGESVLALHINYGLRQGAEADERHCVELCARLEVPLEVRRPRRPARGNLQAWARQERYAAAAQLAVARGADVAAGHTATDQVETILYRLASSPSRRALLGMRARDGLVVRPLLPFTREQTAAYCRRRRLSWREDESNDSGAFARNRIRAALVPALLEVHPGAADNVLALAQTLRDEAALLDSLVDGVLDGRHQLELSRLRELPDALARLVVQRLADEAAGGLAPGAARRAHDVARLSDRGTVELDLGSGVRAVAEYGTVRFERRAPRPEIAGDERRAPRPEIAGDERRAPRPGSARVEGRARAGGLAEREALAPVRLRIPGSVLFGGVEVRCDLGPPIREPGVLDRGSLGGELVVRSWRPGDRMSPLGLEGSKSLQDLFTARRVRRRERTRAAVVESEGEIVWVAGVATSEHFKVTESTREAVHLSARQADHPGERSPKDRPSPRP
jgi:tRNA(Ile)-lysidine synthase